MNAPRSCRAFVLVWLSIAVAGPAPGETYRDAYGRYKAALIAGDIETALLYARKGHGLAVESLGPNAAQTGVLAYNIGAVSYRLKRFRDAYTPLQEAVSTYAKTHGADSPKNILPLRKLADTCAALEKWSEAERHAVRAMEIIEGERGRSDPEVTEILMDLIHLARSLEQPNRMRGYSLRALANLRKSGEPDALDIGHVHVSLATAEMLRGEASATNKSLDRALEIYELRLAPDDASLLSLYSFAADAFEQTGRPRAARKYRRRLKEAQP